MSEPRRDCLRVARLVDLDHRRRRPLALGGCSLQPHVHHRPGPEVCHAPWRTDSVVIAVPGTAPGTADYEDGPAQSGNDLSITSART